mgnify:CR=1 FL=1
MVEGPCSRGLTKSCFDAYPAFARQALAFKILHILFPKEITRKLPKIFRGVLLAPGEVLPPGIELPGGTVVTPGVVFPPGWVPGEPFPPGVPLPPGPVPSPGAIPGVPPPPGAPIPGGPEPSPGEIPGGPLPPGVPAPPIPSPRPRRVPRGLRPPGVPVPPEPVPVPGVPPGVPVPPEPVPIPGAPPVPVPIPGEPPTPGAPVPGGPVGGPVLPTEPPRVPGVLLPPFEPPFPRGNGPIPPIYGGPSVPGRSPGYGGPPPSGWTQILTDAYWQPGNYGVGFKPMWTWDGTKWTVIRGGSFKCGNWPSINPLLGSTWSVGYRPSKARITFNVIGPGVEIALCDLNGNLLGENLNSVSPQEINLDFSAGIDLNSLSSTMIGMYVTNIEFFEG